MNTTLVLEVLQFIVKTIAGHYGGTAEMDAEAKRLLDLIDDERKALHDGLAANRAAADAILAERKKASESNDGG